MLASLRNLLWPKQRRRTVELSIAQKLGSLSLLPEDVFTARVACYFPSRDEYLNLRVASKAMLGLTQRAIASGSSCCRGVPTVCEFGPPPSTYHETLDPARHIAAMARVFGAGCRILHGRVRRAGDSEIRTKEKLAALEYFVASTNGGLTTLDLNHSEVSEEMFLRMCRASPKLTSLQGRSYLLPEMRESTILAIIEACPDLEVVEIANISHSPAETWARHIPRLKTIKCGTGKYLYRPRFIDNIRATALATRASQLDVGGCYITREVIDAVVGTPLGDRIETLGEAGEARDWYETKIFPEALLAAARGFPRLTELHIPQGSTMDGPQFYEQLKRAAPQLRSLHIWDCSTTAACVAAACDMRLERLHLDRLYDHGDRHILDGIINSEASQTLEALDLRFISEEVGFELVVRAADVLRVVRACPRLKRLSWWVVDDGEYDEADRRVLDPDHETYQAIRELLVSRGGIDDWPDCAFDYKRWCH